MLFFFIYITAVSGVPCGSPPLCICKFDAGVLLCKGSNITKIPNFTDEVKQLIIFANFINTGITELPSFGNWSYLAWITLKGNQLFDCSIRGIQDDEVYVDNDCDPSRKLFEVFEDRQPLFLQIMYAFFILPLGLISVYTYVSYIKRKKTAQLNAVGQNVIMM